MTPDVAQASRLHGLGIGHPFLVPRRCVGTGYREWGFCDTLQESAVVNSMTEFKQIIGRGTRIREDYGKTWFNILDYTGSATRNFADPDFDGYPESEEKLTIDEQGYETKEEVLTCEPGAEAQAEEPGEYRIETTAGPGEDGKREVSPASSTWTAGTSRSLPTWPMNWTRKAISSAGGQPIVALGLRPSRHFLLSMGLSFGSPAPEILDKNRHLFMCYTYSCAIG